MDGLHRTGGDSATSICCDIVDESSHGSIGFESIEGGFDELVVSLTRRPA